MVEDGRLVAMHIARDGDGLRAGSIADGQLQQRQGRRGTIRFGGETAIIEPWPAGASEGETVRARISRAAWREPGRDRLAKAQPAPGRALQQPPGFGPPAFGADAVDRWPDAVAAQWDEAWEQASLGRMAIPSGLLLFQPTAAFLAVDVDGDRPAPADATVALARAIRLWGLGGAIILDVPAADRAARQCAADAFDTAMAGQPFERTAINGFGILQVVTPRPGPSILERAQLDRAGSAAVALLAAATREPRPGALRLTAAPAITRWIAQRPHLLATLARQTGRTVDLNADPMAGEGHVETRT